MKNLYLLLVLIALSACKEGGGVTTDALPEAPPSDAIEQEPSPEPEEPVVEEDPEPEPEEEEPTGIDYSTYLLTGIWVNDGDPNLRFSFNQNQTGNEDSCSWSFQWTHLQYSNPEESAGVVFLTQLVSNTNPSYCLPANGIHKQQKQCSWLVLGEDEMQISCLYGLTPQANNIWRKQ